MHQDQEEAEKSAEHSLPVWGPDGSTDEIPIGTVMRTSEANPVKNLTPEQKLLLSLRLYYSAYELKIASQKKFHPGLSDREIQEKVKKIFSHARS